MSWWATTDDDAWKPEFEWVPHRDWSGARARGKSYIRAFYAAVLTAPVLWTLMTAWFTGTAHPAFVILLSAVIAFPTAVFVGVRFATLVGRIDTTERPLKHRVRGAALELVTPRPRPAVTISPHPTRPAYPAMTSTSTSCPDTQWSIRATHHPAPPRPGRPQRTAAFRSR